MCYGTDIIAPPLRPFTAKNVMKSCIKTAIQWNADFGHVMGSLKTLSFQTGGDRLAMGQVGPNLSKEVSVNNYSILSLKWLYVKIEVPLFIELKEHDIWPGKP